MWVAERRAREQVAISAWDSKGNPVEIVVAVARIDREHCTVRIAVDAPQDIKLQRVEHAKNARNNAGNR
jgi:sRNA-binding carbon storage regulator CsrA